MEQFFFDFKEESMRNKVEEFLVNMVSLSLFFLSLSLILLILHCVVVLSIYFKTTQVNFIV